MVLCFDSFDTLSIKTLWIFEKFGYDEKSKIKYRGWNPMQAACLTPPPKTIFLKNILKISSLEVVGQKGSSVLVHKSRLKEDEFWIVCALLGCFWRKTKGVYFKHTTTSTWRCLYFCLDFVRPKRAPQFLKQSAAPSKNGAHPTKKKTHTSWHPLEIPRAS